MIDRRKLRNGLHSFCQRSLYDVVRDNIVYDVLRVVHRIVNVCRLVNVGRALIPVNCYRIARRIGPALAPLGLAATILSFTLFFT